MTGAGAPVLAGEITEDQWDDFFVHVPNPVDGSMIWDYTDPVQQAALQQIPESHVWTFSDCDGGQCITTGISRVNRVGYCVTEHPHGDPIGDEDVWASMPDEEEFDDY